ncbi:MAG TPA: hypothetical protein VN081_06755 [Dongiaceae bacterium]|nr:hypothetical protein [Dongiaceae bacterium]
MSLNLLTMVITFVAYPCFFLYILFGLRKKQAVRGSIAHHKASTQMIVSIIAVTVCTIAEVFIAILQKDIVTASTDFVVAVFWVWINKEHFDDDNWFNDQWKRLKRGFKKLRQRLATGIPLPLPSPA